MLDWNKKEAPVLGLLGSGGGLGYLAGGAAAADPLYVDDIFSTYVYDAPGTALSINNGIDLAGEGGMVWTKARDGTRDHQIADTEQGTSYTLVSNSTAAAGSGSYTAFNSNGYSIGTSSHVNSDAYDYVSWTFRKAPGFFDVVTWSGTNTNRDIAHNLGSVPGMVIVKRTDASDAWYVYHRSHGATKYLELNLLGNGHTSSATWNDTTPTSSVFTVGSFLNATGATYVAYIFAHDSQVFGTDEDESIIKCGTYTGNGSTQEINLGFEPQWFLTKRVTGSDYYGWQMYDIMRGMPVGGGDAYLRANLTTAEGNYDDVDPTPTGLTIKSGSGGANASGATYIYMAIRRPHKPPTAAINVFDDVAYTGNSGVQDITISPSFADFVLIKRRTAGDNWGLASRLTGPLQHMSTNNNNAEATRAAADAVEFDRMSAFGLVGNSSGEVNYNNEPLISYIFKRAPGFMDVVTYTGTGSATTINHNLGAVPSVVLIKGRNTTYSWYWQHYALGANTWLQLNNQEAGAGNGGVFNSTLPTSSVFSVGSLAGSNGSGNTYIAYLFADLPGISKAGTFSGTGNDINVDCGFTSGARFVLIKRTDGSGNVGDWYVWDTARGINSGNDPYLLLNDGTAQVTNTDYIDPLNAGFTVTSSAPAALNASGGTYIFLAIA